ncbi:MAG: xanthine dehydrogenase small subunit [Gammaproteobacteria bacterium]|nr:xanthine dehydrogenase small subunit [Gammaproteobacteria bacterium]
MIRFLLNSVEQLIEDLDPNTTVLDYLRLHLRRTGTKEGCASGDCGACTVVLAEAREDQLRYSAINACITPIGNLHGKQLITVEDLKQGAVLHPVQQAMVDCHGSQCGFCTPGFVMSMFAYRKTHAAPDRESLLEALGGNLCRCTGYRPIVDAGMQMYEADTGDSFDASADAVLNTLKSIDSNTDEVFLSGNHKSYFAPRSLAHLASALLENPEARLVAGATDLALEMTQGLEEIDTLLYPGLVPELQTVRDTGTALEIGAAVTYSQFSSQLCAEYPEMAELIERLGSLQIRNQGTLGGNIGNASPIGDMAPALIAIGADLVLRRGDAVRVVAVEDYFVSYLVTVLQVGEFIERIIVPKARAGEIFKVYKVSKRWEDDISAVCGAFRLRVVDGKVAGVAIAFGGMAEIPKRAHHCEQAMLGQAWAESSITPAMAALAQDFTPISDFRASADYRMQVAGNLLQRLFLETQPGAATVRVRLYA